MMGDELEGLKRRTDNRHKYFSLETGTLVKLDFVNVLDAANKEIDVLKRALAQEIASGNERIVALEKELEHCRKAHQS